MCTRDETGYRFLRFKIISSFSAKDKTKKKKDEISFSRKKFSPFIQVFYSSILMVITKV
jgi:O-glycosyl hydrolase